MRNALAAETTRREAAVKEVERLKEELKKVRGAAKEMFQEFVTGPKLCYRDDPDRWRSVIYGEKG